MGREIESGPGTGGLFFKKERKKNKRVCTYVRAVHEIAIDALSQEKLIFL
jgi:hypothetical protein